MKISKAMRIRNKTNYYAIQFVSDLCNKKETCKFQVLTVSRIEQNNI